MERALGFLIGLIIVCDLAVIGVHVLDENTSLVSGAQRSTSGPSSARPGRGQAFLTGELERLAADNAQVPALTSPFTITEVEQGAGRVTIDRALVSGRRVTISWNGGTALPISGAGGLELGATHVEVDAGGVVWLLDGAPRTFAPGTYRLGAPVGVGSGGIATPREGVEFTADSETALNAHGKVVVKADVQRLELTGPGSLTATGRLRLQFANRSMNASTVNLRDAPFRLTVEPAEGKLRVDALLQGRVEAG